MRNLSRLDEILFKWSRPLKNTYLITWKNYLVPARTDVFHNLDLLLQFRNPFLTGWFCPCNYIIQVKWTKMMFLRMWKGFKQSL